VCKEIQPAFTALRSWAFFSNPLRQAIHRLKYRRDLALGELLSRPLIELFESLDWQVDIVVPVPLSVARLTERGYNQSALLAKPISDAKGISYKPNALKRIRETRSQVDLSLEERWKNVDGAFGAIPRIVAGKNILLVDDVTTSGATINACSHALITVGAKSIYALTLARTA
jgi:ComF family protein